MSLEEFSEIKVKQGKFKTARINTSAPISSNSKPKGNSGKASEVVVKVVSHIKKGSMGVLKYIAKDHHEDEEHKLSDKEVEKNELKESDSLAKVTNYISRDGNILLQHSSGADMDEADLKKLMVDWNKQFQEDEKKNARTMTHVVMSSDKCKDPDEFKKIVAETLSESMTGNHEYVFAVHRDTKNLHAHVVINNYGLDNKKLHIDKNWSQEQRVIFAETLCRHGYDHKATLKHHRNLDKENKQKIAENETYVKDYFSAKVKTAHPEQYKNIIHLRKLYESTGNAADLANLRKEIQLASMNSTNAKLKLDRVVKESNRITTKLKVDRNIRSTLNREINQKTTRLEKKQVSAVTEMLLLEKKLIDKGQLSDKRYQAINEIKRNLDPKLLDQAESNLRRRQDPVFSKLDNELLKYQRGILKNGIDTSKHDERLFKIVALEQKIANQSNNLSQGHKKLLTDRMDKVIGQYKKEGVDVDAARRIYDKQKSLTVEVRLLRYAPEDANNKRFIEAQSKIPATALTEKDRVRLERSLRREFERSRPNQASKLQEAEKVIRGASKAIQTTLNRGKVSRYSLAVNGARLQQAEKTLNEIGIKSTNISNCLNKAYQQLEPHGITRQSLNQHAETIRAVEATPKQPTPLKTFSDLLERTSSNVISTKVKIETTEKLKTELKLQHPEVASKVQDLEKQLFSLSKANQTLEEKGGSRERIESNAVKLAQSIREANQQPFVSHKAIERAKTSIASTLSDEFTQATIEKRLAFQGQLQAVVTTPSDKAIKQLYELASKELEPNTAKHMKSEIRNMMKTVAPEKFSLMQESEKTINQANKAIRTLEAKSGDQSQWIEKNGIKIAQAMNKMEQQGLQHTDAYQKAVQSIDSLNKHGIKSAQLIAIVKVSERVEKMRNEISSLLETGDVHKATAKINTLDAHLRENKIRLPKETYQTLQSIKADVSNKSVELTKESAELSKRIKPITDTMTNLEKVRVRKANKPYVERQQVIQQKLTGKAPKRDRSIKR